LFYGFRLAIIKIMHPIQRKLLELSKKENLAKLSLREMAKLIGMPHESPQKIKHHLLQLQKKGFLTLDRNQGVMNLIGDKSKKIQGLLEKSSTLFSIPIIGVANCGPANIFADENFQGFLKVSSKLINRSKPDGLFVIKAEGSSMNRANVKGKTIDDGDYMIVDKNDLNPIKTGDVVLAIIDNKATVKKFIDDRRNGQIVLMADSSFDYEPIFIHQDDNFQINGKVIKIIKKPNKEGGIS
jgi:SOS-response transcriptional repressor LexA